MIASLDPNLAPEEEDEDDSVLNSALKNRLKTLSFINLSRMLAKAYFKN